MTAADIRAAFAKWIRPEGSSRSSAVRTDPPRSIRAASKDRRRWTVGVVTLVIRAVLCVLVIVMSFRASLVAAAGEATTDQLAHILLNFAH